MVKIAHSGKYVGANVRRSEKAQFSALGSQLVGDVARQARGTKAAPRHSPM
jgi:hypothetical protein